MSSPRSRRDTDKKEKTKNWPSGYLTLREELAKTTQMQEKNQGSVEPWKPKQKTLLKVSFQQ